MSDDTQAPEQTLDTTDVDRWVGSAGTSITTALALLSMEHALFLR